MGEHRAMLGGIALPASHDSGAQRVFKKLRAAVTRNLVRFDRWQPLSFARLPSAVAFVAAGKSRALEARGGPDSRPKIGLLGGGRD